MISFIPRDRLQEFLTTFGGQTITVPTWAYINSMVNDAWLLWKYKECKKGRYSLKTLSKETGLTKRQVVMKVDLILKDLPME